MTLEKTYPDKCKVENGRIDFCEGLDGCVEIGGQGTKYILLPENIAAALALFDNAAQEHGWQRDQGSRKNAVEARAAWQFAKHQLEAAIEIAMSAPAPRSPSREEIARVLAKVARNHIWEAWLFEADAILALFSTPAQPDPAPDAGKTVSAPAQAARGTVTDPGECPECEAILGSELVPDRCPVCGEPDAWLHREPIGRKPVERVSAEIVTDELVERAWLAAEQDCKWLPEAERKATSLSFNRKRLRLALEAASLPSRPEPAAPVVVPNIPWWKDGLRTAENPCCSANEPCSVQRQLPHALCRTCFEVARALLARQSASGAVSDGEE